MPSYPTTKVKTLKYDSPSGKINITKWIPPFIPVGGGYGFIGVLAEDSKTGQLQCHYCGEWYEILTTHIVAKHGFNSSNEYREEYGLSASTALQSKRIRLIHSKVMSDFRKTGQKKFLRKFAKNNAEAANRKGKPKAVETQNKYGVCDLQIMTKILALAKKLGKTPTLVDIQNEYGGGMITTMHSRYGSYIQYCREKLKMEPNWSSTNPRPDSYWKKLILEEGRKAMKDGKPMVIKRFLSPNTQRYIYRYFGSFPKYKKALLKTYGN